MPVVIPIMNGMKNKDDLEFHFKFALEQVFRWFEFSQDDYN